MRSSSTTRQVTTGGEHQYDTLRRHPRSPILLYIIRTLTRSLNNTRRKRRNIRVLFISRILRLINLITNRNNMSSMIKLVNMNARTKHVNHTTRRLTRSRVTSKLLFITSSRSNLTRLSLFRRDIGSRQFSHRARRKVRHHMRIRSRTNHSSRRRINSRRHSHSTISINMFLRSRNSSVNTTKQYTRVRRRYQNSNQRHGNRRRIRRKLIKRQTTRKTGLFGDRRLHQRRGNHVTHNRNRLFTRGSRTRRRRRRIHHQKRNQNQRQNRLNRRDHHANRTTGSRIIKRLRRMRTRQRSKSTRYSRSMLLSMLRPLFPRNRFHEYFRGLSFPFS